MSFHPYSCTLTIPTINIPYSLSSKKGITQSLTLHLFLFSSFTPHTKFLPSSSSSSFSSPNKGETHAPMEVLPPWELTTHLHHPFFTSSIHHRPDFKELGDKSKLGKLWSIFGGLSSRVCFYLLISL